MIDPKQAKLIEETKAKYTIRWWEPEFDPLEMAYYQLHEPVYLVRFGDYHVALESLLGRSIWAHEFRVCIDELRAEAARARAGKPYSEAEKDAALQRGMDRIKARIGGQVTLEENSPEDPEGNAKDRRMS